MNTALTEKYAVIGDPIGHSLSPKMHNAAFKALSIDAEYSAIHVTASQLPEFIRTAKQELAGFNVTVPHKNAVIEYMDEVSEECRITGSVNTVVNSNGTLKGYSTDGYGLRTAIESAFSLDIRSSSVLFLGCGGTVKAVSYYLLRHTVNRLFIANRTLSTAQELVNYLQKLFPETEIGCISINDLRGMEKLIGTVDVLIQATSLGLKDNDPSPIPAELLHKNLCVFDTIYRQTHLIREAEKRGITHADGTLMLLHQGAKAFSLWTGLTPPVEIMHQALQSATH